MKSVRVGYTAMNTAITNTSHRNPVGAAAAAAASVLRASCESRGQGREANLGFNNQQGCKRAPKGS